MDKTHSPYTFFLNGHNPESDSLARLTLEDFRDRSGLSGGTLERSQVCIFTRTVQSRLSLIECGLVQPKQSEIESISRVFETSVDNLNGLISCNTIEPKEGEKQRLAKTLHARPGEIWNNETDCENMRK